MARNRARGSLLHRLAAIAATTGVALSGAVIGLVPGVLPAPIAAAYSAFNPPPLCSVTPGPSCIAQPGTAYIGLAASPLRIDMPTMSINSLDPDSPYSGEVTFVITSFGIPAAGTTFRNIHWSNPVVLTPVDAEPTATLIFMAPKGNCEGRQSCTYTTTSTDLKGGWYSANYAGSPVVLAGEDMCPPSGFGCSATYSQSAVYIPNITDKEPPAIAANAVGSGRITKAIAVAEDPYGQSMSLLWDFGDGTPAVPGNFGQVISHTYAFVGNFSIMARVQTTDGRNAATSIDAGITPPKPFLLSVDRVPAPNNGVGAVASGLVQGWPAGTTARIITWSTGCPADPSSNSALSTGVPGGSAPVAGSGTIDIASSFLDPDANAAVMFVEGYIAVDGHDVKVSRVSDCLTVIGSAAKTTTDLSIGATEVQVPSSTVPIGNMMLIGSGSGAERRLVTGHASLIVGALSQAHPSGSPVVDLGAPKAPYVEPGPPADPVAPVLGGGGGGGGTEYVALVPGRFLDTRTDPGITTIDGQGKGAGLRPAGSITEIQITGRNNIPSNATAAVLNLTITGPLGAGYATAFPCGTTPPTTSNVNYTTGTTIPNNVIAKIGTNGRICILTFAPTHLIADIAGYYPAGATYTPLVPGRFLDTRTDPGITTIDGQGKGAGLRPAGSITEIQITGRNNIPSNATAAVLNLTITGPLGAGYATAFPCGTTPPTTSNVNYTTGTTIPNNVIAKIGTNGRICILTFAPTHLIADIAGYYPAGATYTPLVPGRFLDTRTDPGITTIDGQGKGAGLRPAGSITEIQITGRNNIPSNATAAVLNLTITGPLGAGYATAFPCGTTPPTTSNVNYTTGITIPNNVIAKIGTNGRICILTFAPTHLIADIAGYYPA